MLLRFLTLALLTASALFAQLQSGEIRLRISDASNLPVPAAVSLASEASRTHRDAKSSDNGECTFQHLPFGIYQVSVAAEGFQTYLATVDVRSSVPNDLHVHLLLASEQTKVEVSAEPTIIDPDRTGVDYPVGSQQLNESMSTVPGRSVLDLINDQPGWLFEANGVLHPRGSEYQTQFVVDGMPMEENRSPGFAPGLDAQNVAEMSVLTSDIPAEYGRKLGGIVEVTTEPNTARGFHGEAEAGGGSFDTETGFASLTYGGAHSSFSVDGEASRTDRYSGSTRVAELHECRRDLERGRRVFD